MKININFITGQIEADAGDALLLIRYALIGAEHLSRKRKISLQEKSSAEVDAFDLRECFTELFRALPNIQKARSRFLAAEALAKIAKKEEEQEGGGIDDEKAP